MYQWLNYGLNMAALFLYGIIFHWIPIYLRSRRTSKSNRFVSYFKFLRIWESVNTVFKIKYPFIDHYIYIQPSLLIIFSVYLTINGVFSILDTKDLDYLPWKYIVAKRISRVAIANLPLIYIYVIKNDLLTSITGLKHDKLVLIHKWIARTMFAMICIHVGLCCNYWLALGFPIMLVIPPQIFGYIALTSFGLLTFGSVKFVRRWAYDFFLVQHRVLSFIMLLFAFFHNRKGTETAVILAVHQLVIDRILSRVLSFIHVRQSPTRGKSTFEILDEDTLLVTVKLKAFPFKDRKWYYFFLPKINTWKAGQHVYLTVGKISAFQQHPFTISSLSELKEMKFVIRVQKGFTKKLMKKITQINEQKELGNDISALIDDRSLITKAIQRIKVMYQKRKEGGQSIELDEIIETEVQENNVFGKDLNNSKQSKSFSPNNSFDSNSSLNSISVETELLASSKKPKSKKSITSKSEADIDSEEDIEPLLKATFVGPVGAHYQPLITFDGAVFLSAGSGASFTFPVCLDLLNDIQLRNEQQDYINRNPEPLIKFVWVIRKTENINWYKFLWDDLVPFCNSGMLKIDIFITQENNDKSYNPKRFTEKIAIETITDNSSSSSSNGPQENSKSLQPMKSVQMETEISEECSILSHQSLSVFDAKNVSFHKFRPDMKQVISGIVDPLRDNKDYKSLAVLSCGPEPFTHSIKSTCNSLRWVPDAPDIYCYTESFG